MMRWFDNLNLRPQERRLVVLGSTVLFVVLNLWLVWPHFGDWGRAHRQLTRAQETLNTYQNECNQTNLYQTRLKELEGQGAGVLPEERATALLSEIQQEANRHGVNCGNVSPLARNPRSKLADFFEEQNVNVGLNPSAPDSVIKFLFALGSSELVIRVRELDLKPDATQTKLMGNMRLVASFQKKSTARPDVTKPNPAAARKS